MRFPVRARCSDDQSRFSSIPAALQRRRLIGFVVMALVLWPLGLSMPVIADETQLDKSEYTLFVPTPDADLRSFNTDRPPKANSPYTVDAGHFQYETDLAVFGTGNTEGVRTHQWTVLDPTFKLGLTNNIDAEVQLTPYESSASRSAAGTIYGSGVGDTIVRLKMNFVGNDHGNLSIALLPYLKVPTAASDLGNRAVEAGLILPFTVSAPAGFTITLMPEGDYLKNVGQVGYHTIFDFLVNVSHALDKRWTVYSEAFTSQPFKAGSFAIYTLDEALTCLLAPNLQLDFGGNFALNDIAPKVQIYAGLSQRF